MNSSQDTAIFLWTLHPTLKFFKNSTTHMKFLFFYSSIIREQSVVRLKKQGVALTWRKTTGPPSRAAPWWVTLHMRRCYRRQQTPVSIASLARLHCV